VLHLNKDVPDKSKMVRLAEKIMKTQYCDRKHVRPVIVLTHDMVCISEKRLT
jgi:hypothetical protein